MWIAGHVVVFHESHMMATRLHGCWLHLDCGTEHGHLSASDHLFRAKPLHLSTCRVHARPSVLTHRCRATHSPTSFETDREPSGPSLALLSEAQMRKLYLFLDQQSQMNDETIMYILYLLKTACAIGPVHRAIPPRCSAVLCTP